MKGIARKGALVLLGVLLGSSITQAVTYRTRVELLNQTRLARLDAHRWRYASYRLRDQIAALNRKRQRSAKPYVQTVNLEVIHSPVPVIDVEAALEPYTETLLGMELSSLKLSLAYHLIEGRQVVLQNQPYRVVVKGLLLSPDAVILITLHPLRLP